MHCSQRSYRFWPRSKRGWLLAAAAAAALLPALWVLYRTVGAFVGMPVPPWLNRWPAELQFVAASVATIAAAAWAVLLATRESGGALAPGDSTGPAAAPNFEVVDEPSRDPYASPRRHD